jgi:glycosyltransferase involved in cell wall biosynthesis
MKVAIVTNSFCMGDGIGNLCRARTKGLLNAGHEVAVHACEADAWHETHPKLALHTYPEGTDDSTGNRFELLDSPADVVIVDFGFHSHLHRHLHNVTSPLILSYHGITPCQLVKDSMYDAAYWQTIGELRLLPSPRLIITESLAMHKELKSISEYFDTPHRVVQGFGSTVATTPTPIAHSASLKLLCVSRIFPNKHFETAIEAVERLCKQGVDVTLDIVGSAGSRDSVAQRYSESLKRLSKRCPGKVQFWGRVPQQQLDQMYKHCSAVVIPSLHEGFSLPAVEALMHGKPVFSSHLAALPETLGNAAIYFNPFSSLDLAEKIKAFQQYSIEQLTTLQQTALRRAHELTDEAFIRNSLTAIESVVDRNPIRVARRNSIDVEYVPAKLDPNLQFNATAEWSASEGLMGKILFKDKQSSAAISSSLRATSFCDQLIDTLTLPLRCETGAEGDLCRIDFRIPAECLTTATEVLLSFAADDDDHFCSQLAAVRIPLAPKLVQEGNSNDLPQLRDLLHQCIVPRVIRLPEKAGLFARLQCRVANKFLAIVHRSFIAPQVAFQIALLRQLEKRSRD